MQKYSGKFIVIEGLDGSGQSTQVNLLKEALFKEGQEVIATKEPTDKAPIGALIRQVLKKEIKITPAALQLLFCADRSEHLAKIIQPAVEAGKWVISDRYFYSTIAYGQINLDFDWLVGLNQVFLRPELAFLLKVRPEICLRRIDNSRSSRQFFEGKEKLEKVWRGYERLAGCFNEVRIIDGEKSIKEVYQEIWKALREG